MSDDKTNTGSDGQNEEQKQQEQVENKQVDTTALEANIAKLTKDLENARKGERFAKSTKEDLQKRVDELEASFNANSEYKAKYEQAEEKLKNFALDGALTEAAKAAKAKDVKAVMKLVDRSAIVIKDGVVDTKTIEVAMAQTKKDYEILFDKVELPPSGRAAEGASTNDYQKEIYAAKSFKEIEAVQKKYNKA